MLKLFPEGLFRTALENIYAERVDVTNDIEPNLFNATYGVLGEAVNKAFGTVEWGQPNYEFVQALRQNVAVFSAFKTHSQQNELAALLTDDKGNIKSFSKFSNDSQPVIGRYNGAWLRTEYNTAVIRARFAARWKDFEADADLYPNLMWMPSTSLEPRQSHIQYYGKVWPIGDPFWNSQYPGNEWNCKCGITNTDQPPSHFAPANPAPAMPGLDSNPATSAELIAQSHPIIKKASKNARKAVDEFVGKLTELTVENRQIYDWADGLTKTWRAKGDVKSVSVIDDSVKDFARKNKINLSDNKIVLADKAITHMLRDSKAFSPSINDVAKIEGYLNQASVYFDKSHNNFIYFIDNGNDKILKFTVQPDYKMKINKKIRVVNYVTTGGYVDVRDLSKEDYIKIRD